MNWGAILEHGLIAVFTVVVWYLQRNTVKHVRGVQESVDAVHSIVNHQRDEMMAKIERLEAKIAELRT